MAQISIALMLTATAALTASSASVAASGGPEATIAPTEVKVISNELLSQVGVTIEIKGVFQAWSVDVCQFPTALRTTAMTRSDWLVRVGDNCIYVTGGFPPGGSVSPADKGKQIAVTGAVVKDSEGRLILHHASSRFIT